MISLKPHATPFTGNQAWTWLFYDAADSTDIFDPFESFSHTAYNSQNLTILVLQDTETQPGRLWRINTDHSLTMLKDLGEVNMGDSETMEDFITYGKENAPADRFLLSIYDHGGAWSGTCYDNHPNEDSLTMHELQQAIADAGGIDLLCYTAPCLMGSLEAAYELRNDVQAIIGDEELSGYKYWWEAVDEISALLTDQSRLSTDEIAGQIIHIIQNNNPNEHLIAMSAVRTETLVDLRQTLNALCKDCLRRWLSSFRILVQAHEQTLSFGAPDNESFQLYDVYHFMENLDSTTSNTRMKQDIHTFQESFNRTIIASYCGREDAHGMSIYFPDLWMNGRTRLYGQASYGLDFSSDTIWNKFLYLYVFTVTIFG